MSRFALISSVILASSFASAAMAHVGDIGLKVVSGRINTGVVDDIGFGQFVVPGERVFGGDMGDIFPGFSDEPGYFSSDGSFPQGTGIGFNIRKAMRHWSGTDFNSIASQTLLIENAAATDWRVTPGTDVPVPGFDILSVDASGGFDEHLNFTVTDPNTPAIYLLELETTGTGLLTSDPYWIVFNNGLSEDEHDAAMVWTQQNLAPAPGAGGVLVLAGVLGGRRRRA